MASNLGQRTSLSVDNGLFDTFKCQSRVMRLGLSLTLENHFFNKLRLQGHMSKAPKKHIAYWWCLQNAYWTLGVSKGHLGKATKSHRYFTYDTCQLELDNHWSAQKIEVVLK